MSTLLEKAKSTRLWKPKTIEEEFPTDEVVELLVAYLDSVITIRQASTALGFKYPGNFTHWTSKVIKQLYKQGKIQVVK